MRKKTCFIVFHGLIFAGLLLTFSACNPLSSGRQSSTLPSNHNPGVADSSFTPSVTNDSFSTPKNTAKTSTLTGTKPSVGGTISFSIISNPQKGVLSIDSSTGAFTYTPNTNEIGIDSFTFVAMSSAGRSSSVATVFINILDTGSSDVTPPAEASALARQSPTSTPSNNTTPIIRVSVTPEAGQIVKLYTATTTAQCTSGNLVGQATGSGATIDVASTALSDGTYGFRVTTQDSFGNVSSCSTANVSYQVDTVAPDAVNAVSLYSAYTSGVSATASYTPDIILTYTGGDNAGGGGLSHFEYKLIDNDTSTTVQDWTSGGSARTFRGTGLSLTTAHNYKVQVRAVDNAGNASAALDSSTWQVVVASGTPFDGLGLPSVTTLADNTLSNTTVLNTTRSGPSQAKILTVDGSLSWDTSGHSAVFLRADQLALQPGVVISANGSDATNANGGKGGSGGGGGGNTCGGNVAGAAAGSDGASGSSGGGCGPGTGGTGTAASYNAGFTFGSGGSGTSAAGTNPGAGGTGGNANGGGGGGTAGSTAKGGGGGGGLISIVANSITGSGFIRANGGRETAGGNGSAWTGGNGGGGVIWVAAGSYTANLYDEVFGGGEGTRLGSGNQALTASAGSSLIYQLNPDGSLTQRRFMDSWGTGVATIGLTLPIPVANLPDVTTIADTTLTGPTTLDASIYTRVNPFSAKTLTVNGTVSWDTNTYSAIFMNVNQLVLGTSAVIDASGTTATGASGTGVAGKGGSGGGSGSNASGNAGGTGGTDGSPGLTFSSRAGGIGTCTRYRAGFDYGNGGTGGTAKAGGAGPGVGGAGTNACGGGGGGGSGGGAGGGPGGGGGGLVVVIANDISGTGTIKAAGGGGSTSGSNFGGGGGGGVIWIAAKTYNGGITADVSGGAAGGTGASDGSSGTAKIFKINNDGTLTQKLFSDSW